MTDSVFVRFSQVLLVVAATIDDDMVEEVVIRLMARLAALPAVEVFLPVLLPRVGVVVWR